MKEVNSKAEFLMYKYEMHLHTAPVSACGRKSARENLEFYKKLGYDGVFITNHFLDGNISVDRSLPYEEKINFYFSDYEDGVKIGGELGIKVFCGVEMTYGGTDFLVFGIDKEWWLTHPEIMDMKKSEQLTLLMENGALIFQAHPFREARWIDHFRLYPCVQGVEVINAGRPDPQNQMAELYATHYGKLKIAGTDNHLGADAKRLAGICTKKPIESVEDFICAMTNGETELFHEPNPLAPITE